MPGSRSKSAASNSEGEPRRTTYDAGAVIAKRYVLTTRIGEGGMGAVWRARNLTLEIDVALKLIHRDLTSSDMAARLLQEARAAARIDHPSIVRVYEFGETDEGDPFIAMELLKGEELASRLEAKGRMAALVAVRTMMPVLGALSAAHDKGIVHRDIKPENIMLCTSASGAVLPKILDFGIAKVRPEEGGTRKKITHERTLVGTPDYMSPEQASGEGEVDARTDVWAMSVLFYEMMTGVRPFEGATYNAVLIAVATKTPVPITDLAAGDAELWSLLERGLAKSPDDRWPSMRAFGVALATWLRSKGVETDSAGNSLATHWLGDRERPLSEHPPPMTDRGSLSGARSIPGEPPEARVSIDAPRQRRIGMLAVAVAIVVVAALSIGVWLLVRSPAATPIATAEPSATPPPLSPSSAEIAVAPPSASSAPVVTPVATAAPTTTASTRRDRGKAGKPKDPTLAVPTKPDF